jgi:antitoxin PrlF
MKPPPYGVCHPLSRHAPTGLQRFQTGASARRPALHLHAAFEPGGTHRVGQDLALTRKAHGITIRNIVRKVLARAMTETTLTSKGQVTVPREIRDRLGLESGDKLRFTMLSDGTVIMRAKTRRLIDLAGSLTRPGQPKVSIEQMNPFKR